MGKNEIVREKTNLVATDWDGTVWPMEKADKSSLVKLLEEMKDRGEYLNLVPVTGRPAGCVPVILETINSITNEAFLPPIASYGLGESGQRKKIPINAEYDEFIMNHRPDIVKQCSEMREKLFETLNEKFGYRVGDGIETDLERRYSTVLKCQWKDGEREIFKMEMDKLPNLAYNFDFIYNPDGGVQVDHKDLDKAKSMEYVLFDAINKGMLVKTFSFCCDGSNDIGAARWTVQFAKELKASREDMTEEGKGERTNSIESMYKCFDNFSDSLKTPHEVSKFKNNLKINLEQGLEKVNVFMPEKVHSLLSDLKHENRDMVKQSRYKTFTGILDCMDKNIGNSSLNLAYDSLYKGIHGIMDPVKNDVTKLNIMQKKQLITLKRQLSKFEERQELREPESRRDAELKVAI